MKKIECNKCCKTMGYVNDEFDNIQDEDCICEECYNKGKNKEINFTIVSKPDHISLTCPFCSDEIEIPFDDVPKKGDSWEFHGLTIECPNCKEEVTLGDWDYD